MTNSNTIFTCKLSDCSTEMWWFFGDKSGFFYEAKDDIVVYYLRVSLVFDNNGSEALWPKKL